MPAATQKPKNINGESEAPKVSRGVSHEHTKATHKRRTKMTNQALCPSGKVAVSSQRITQ